MIDLTRLSFESCIPWGFQINSQIMKLTGCAVGSIAAGNERARGCVWMRVERMNDMQVRTKEQMIAITEERTNTTGIKMKFN